MGPRLGAIIAMQPLTIQSQTHSLYFIQVDLDQVAPEVIQWYIYAWYVTIGMQIQTYNDFHAVPYNLHSFIFHVLKSFTNVHVLVDVDPPTCYSLSFYFCDVFFVCLPKITITDYIVATFLVL